MFLKTISTFGLIGILLRSVVGASTEIKEDARAEDLSILYFLISDALMRGRLEGSETTPNVGLSDTTTTFSLRGESISPIFFNDKIAIAYNETIEEFNKPELEIIRQRKSISGTIYLDREYDPSINHSEFHWLFREMKNRYAEHTLNVEELDFAKCLAGFSQGEIMVVQLLGDNYEMEIAYRYSDEIELDYINLRESSD